MEGREVQERVEREGARYMSQEKERGARELQQDNIDFQWIRWTFVIMGLAALVAFFIAGPVSK